MMLYSRMYSLSMMTIANRLDAAMKDAGFKSQNALSRASGVPQATISRILKGLGKRGPETETLKKLAFACNVPFQWLNEGEIHINGRVAPENALPEPGRTSVDRRKAKKIYVFGRAMGGFPERIWDEDGGWPPGFSDESADVASADENAFLVPIEGESMVPRFNPGEYALVEPNTEPELEDDVLVRLGSGKTIIKRLLSRRGAIRLGSYNSAEIISAPPETIVWMYYVAHPVPARKIKTRI